MPLGTLHLTLPDRQTRDFVVEQASLGVGRDLGNELVIDDASIARRHARLTFEANRLVVEDLGSSQGTFIGSQRLEANTPSLVPAGEPVRLGEVELVYSPSAAPAANATPGELAAGTPARAAGSAPAAPPPIEASLEGPARPVAPGSTTTAELTLGNRGPVVDELTVHVSGVPAAWVRLSNDRVALLPGAHEQVTLSFQPPQHAESVAADHRFTLTVVSREHRTGVNVHGVVQVLPYAGLVLNLQPLRSARDFQVEAHNQGNTPVSLTLSGSDDEGSLLFNFSQRALTLPPGHSQPVELVVTPKVAPRVGTRETRPFTIVAQPDEAGGDGPEARASGQLIIRPPIPIWLIPIAVILALCVCISGTFAYFRLCPAYFPSGPFCPASARPVINVLSATPAEVDTGSTVVIAWDVSNAERVELIAPQSETVEPSGLRAYTLASNTTFILRATNAAGSVDESVSVLVRGTGPSIESFTATPGVYTVGETDTIVLSWTTINADEVFIEGLPAADLSPNGATEVPAPSANTTYTLIASNDTGNARQAVTIVVTPVDCRVVGLPSGERLGLRAGPGGAYPVVMQLDSGLRVDPVRRNGLGDWLLVRTAGREGWVSASFVTCTDAAMLGALATIEPAAVPTLAPTATSVSLPASPR